MQTDLRTTVPAPAAQRDNMLGICHAIGTTFGFNPLWLRIALAAMLLVSAEIALLVYAICGVAVVAGYLLAPRRPVMSSSLI